VETINPLDPINNFEFFEICNIYFIRFEYPEINNSRSASDKVTEGKHILTLIKFDIKYICMNELNIVYIGIPSIY